MNKYYVSLIEQGVESWNRWREEHPNAKPDLDGAYLFEADLRGANLTNASLSRACLIGANLQGADLSGANLSHVYASSANLSEVELAFADLSGANLTGANLTYANLSGVRAGAANLTNAHLTGACLADWQMDGTTQLGKIDCKYIYLQGRQQGRYPTSGEFESEEFNKLFQEALLAVKYSKSPTADTEEVLIPIASPLPETAAPSTVAESLPSETHRSTVHLEEVADPWELPIAPATTAATESLVSKAPDHSAYVAEEVADPWEPAMAKATTPSNLQHHRHIEESPSNSRNRNSATATLSAQLDSLQQRNYQLERSFQEPTSTNAQSRPTLIRIGLSIGLLLALLTAIASFIHYRSRPNITPVASAPSNLPPQTCKEPPISSLEGKSVTYQYSNGTKFYGKWANGIPADGRGTMVYSSGNRYDGEYQAGKRNGCGMFLFANGRKYVGQFQDDRFEGQGSWILENGDRYIGAFKDNKCHGQGTFIFADGSYKSGQWQAGNLVGTDLSCDRTPLPLPQSSEP
jgi:hypothetical protein